MPVVVQKIYGTALSKLNLPLHPLPPASLILPSLPSPFAFRTLLRLNPQDHPLPVSIKPWANRVSPTSKMGSEF